MKTKILPLGGMIVMVSGLLFWSWQTAIFAVSSSVTVTSLVTSTTTVKENALTPVFKITFPGVEAGEALSGISVILNSSATSNAATSDVLEDNRTHSGGWQLWKDSASGTAGTFERYTDEQVLLSASSLNYGANGAFTITPDTNVALASNDIFYVAIKTDDTGLPSSTTFTVSLSGMTTTGSTQPSITTVQTSNLSLSVTPRLTKIELLDGGVSAGNRIRMTFNQSMDFSYITTYGLSWYIYQYDASWYQLSFGSSPTTAVSSSGGATNDTLTITLGTSPTITTDRPFYYSLPSAGTSYNWAYGQKRFDATAPTLIKAELITDSGSDGQANDIGDQIAFQFSEAMDMTSATPNNMDAMLPPSSGSYSDSGAKPVVTWWGSSVLVVTLKNNLATDLIGKTVNPANSLTDASGNADNTSTAPTITATSLAPVSSVVLSDIDTANSWLDKNDIGVSYVLPSYSSTVTSDTDFHVDLYLIPESVGFNFSSLYRINSAELTGTTAGTVQSFDGADSTYYLYYDSRTNFVSIANNDWSNLEYNSIEEGTRYIAYAVASTDAHSSETNTGRSIPKPSEPTAFTAESWTESTSQPWISSYSPNSSSVPTNTSSFTMTFSEALDSTSASDIDNYTLKYDSDGNWTYDATVPLTSVSYNSTTFTVTLTTDTTLTASVWHYLQVASSVEDLYGTSVGSWSGMYFQTGSAPDNTAPTVRTINVTNGATNVSPSLSSISVIFSEGMDALTLTTTSATMNPTVAGVSTLYETSSNTLKYTFGNSNMTENTSYTFTLDGSTITDGAGNFLDGDANSTAGGNYSISFTTGVLDTAKPQISWSAFDGYTLTVGFDKEMKEADVEDDTNWTLTCDSTAQTLTWATFAYDEYNKEVAISGLYCSSSASYTITAASNVRGGNNQTIDTDADSDSGTVESATTSGGSVTGSSSYSTYYSPVYVWPSDSSAGATTSYYVSLPTNKSLQDGDKIIIEWPSGFDISNVAVKTTNCGSSYDWSACSWSNGDINGTWNGVYDQSGGTFYDEGVIKLFDTAESASCPADSECVSNDAFQNRTTLTLWLDYNEDGTRDANAVTKTSDYLYFDLSGVVNPTTGNEVDWYTSTGGYTINIYTETSEGAPKEGPLQSSAFSIYSAGTGTASGRVTANTSEGAGIPSTTVYAYGKTTKSTTTDSSGNWTITGLQNGWWYFYASPPSGGQYTYDYSSYTSSSCEITNSNQTCTYNSTLKSLDYSISGSIVHATSLAGKEVSIWQYSQTDYSWSNSYVTLEADGITPYTIYADAGKVQVGLYERYYSNDFVSPDPVTVNVTGNMTGVNFNLIAADKDLPVTVRNQDGVGLENVSVSAYSYDEGYGFGAWGTTGKDGRVTLKVAPGDYTVHASQGGIGSLQKPVSVAEDGTVTPEGGPIFIFRIKDSTGSGTGLDDHGDPISGMTIYYKDSDGNEQQTSTDTNGNYQLSISGGDGVTGTLTASDWRYGGTIPAASGVDITDFAVPANTTITGKNFQYDPNNFGTISGRVLADDTGIQWTSIWAEEVNRTTGIRTGYYGNWTSTDSDGNYTLKISKNSDTTCYDVYAWAGSYGELPVKECLDVSAGNLTNQNWDMGSLQTLTIAVNGAPSSVTTAYIEVVQSGTDIGMWETLTLVNGSATESVDIWDGTYSAKLQIEGFGEFAPDSPDADGFTISGADHTTSFTLTSSITNTLTLTGTVTDSNGAAVEKARVTVFDETTGKTNSVKTASNGTYTLAAQGDTTYTMFASKAKYVNSDQITVTSSGTYNFTIEDAGATITGTAYKDSTAVEGAWIMARSGDQWSSTTSDGAGAFTLDVPTDSSLSWDIEGMTKTGYGGTLRSIAANTSGNTLNLDTQYVTGLADQECTSAVASQSFILDDTEGTGASLKVPANSYTDSSGLNTSAGTFCVSDTAVPLTTTNSIDVVDGKEVLLYDSQGNGVTKLQSDIDMEFEYTKTDIIAKLADGSISSYTDLETFSISYWDDSTLTWVSMPTTKSAKVKLLSSSDWTEADYSTVVANGPNFDAYHDFKLTFHTQSDHLTIFGITVPSDTTAPSAPTGLIATTGNNRVTLDWNNNSETDLMEYNVYRSTSSTVQAINANQVNTTQVTGSAYADTTALNDIRYYYVVTAVDRSGNESSASNTASATPSETADTTAPSAPTGLTATASSGSVTLQWSDNSETDLARYNVYRSTSSTVTVTSGNKINTTNVTASEYTDSTVTNGTKYYYVVTAVDNSENESGASSTVNATPGSTTTTSSPAGGSPNTSSAQTKEKDESVEKDTETTSEKSEKIETPFTDVSGHWGETYIAKLYARGVVEGYSSDTYGPDNKLTRAEFSKIVLKMWGISAPSIAEKPFSDVDTGEWYAGYVSKLKELGIIQGYPDGTFQPNKSINRAEALKMLLAMTGKAIQPEGKTNPFTDVENNAWYTKYVLYASEKSYVSGYSDKNGKALGLFGPGNNVTRAEIAKIATKVLGW